MASMGRVMEIERILNLSTAHLTPDDVDVIESSDHILSWDLEPALLVSVCPRDYHLDDVQVPSNLEYILWYASGRDCQWVMFGPGLPQIYDLPTFEW